MNLELGNWKNSRSTFIFPNFIRKRKSLLKKKKKNFVHYVRNKTNSQINVDISLISLYLKLARNVDISWDNSISQLSISTETNLLDKSQYKYTSDLKQEEDLRKQTPIFTNLYSGESLYKGRPAAQDSTVLRIRIKRWSLRSLLLRPVPPTRKTL